MNGKTLAVALALSAAGAVDANAQTYTRTDTTTYEDNLDKWVIGQPMASVNVDTGLVESETKYDPITALPTDVYAFGKLKQRLTYNADGTVATVSDAKDSATFNTTTTFGNWKRGIPQTITHPDGASTSAVVDDLGQILSATDETGAKTCYAYDAMGRVRKITYPSEATSGVCDASAWAETIVSFSAGNPAIYGMPAGAWWQTTVNGNARKITVYDGLLRPVVEETLDLAEPATRKVVTFRRFDAAGQTVFQSYPLNAPGTLSFADPSLKGTSTTFDALGRPTRVEQHAEPEFGGVVTTTMAYLAGFQTRVTNPRGQATTTAFKTYAEPTTDWPVSIVQPAGSHTDITRDVFGKPTSIRRRDAGNLVSATRTYGYTQAQELCRLHEPETGSTYMGYDAAGLLAWSASGYAPGSTCVSGAAVAARRSDHAYDNRNRITSLTFADGLGNTSYAYTADGLPAAQSVDNGSGAVVTTTYGYNKRRLLTSERMSWASINWMLGYGYDAHANLASQSYPPNVVIDYAPDALGRPTRAGTYATNVTYHPNGRVDSFTYGNGVQHKAHQNARLLPERSRDFRGTAWILDDSYDYDQNGNVVAISDGATAGATDRNMVYDQQDRLTRMTSPMLGGTGAIDYGYDVLDNIVSVSAPNRSQRYCYEDGTNRLTTLRAGATAPCSNGTAAMVAFAYDLQGNLKTKNNVHFQFGLDNRLRSTTGGVASSYVYDALGRRVRDYTTGSRYSLYTQGGLLAYTSDVRKQESAHYVYLGDKLIATRTVPTGSTNATVRYQHTDALGTPVAVTDANGTVIERSHYEPYGKVLNHAARDGVGVYRSRRGQGDRADVHAAAVLRLEVRACSCQSTR